MKKIVFTCLMLFFTVASFSQTDSYLGIVTGSFLTDSPHWEILGLKDSCNTTIILETPEIPLIIKYLKEYQIECYNDSTNVRIHKNTTGGFCLCYGSGGCSISEHYEYIWVHRELNFTDFTNWILLKYKL